MRAIAREFARSFKLLHTSVSSTKSVVDVLNRLHETVPVFYKLIDKLLFGSVVNSQIQILITQCFDGIR